jgi:predicted alpha/beta superfamily hydrolase
MAEVPVADSISRRGVFGASGVLAGGLLSAASARAEEVRPAVIFDSEMFDLTSAQGRVYRISVARPQKDEPALELMIKGRKPTPVYTLDSGTLFGLVSSLTRTMQWGGDVPPCLTVGIGYPDEVEAHAGDVRSLDLTPTSNPGAARPATTYGGAAAFRNFLTTVLKPEIARRYDIDTEASVLAGHSFGGLFTMNTFVEQPDAFTHYLASSPSVWFDDNLVLRRMKERLDAGDRFSGRLAVFAGEREERISRPSAHMTSNVLEIARLVAEHRDQFSGVLARIVPGASHHTIVGSSYTEGLRYLLAPAERLAETY